MTAPRLILFSIPGLRTKDIDKRTTPTLFDWANRGALAELTPTFPCVTSSVQASMWTGVGPDRHGVIANGFYHRDRREVEFWVGRNGVIEAEQIWRTLARGSARRTSAAWHAQNIKDADADFIVTPEPIHEPDGTTTLWCYSKPVGLYPQLLDKLGHFPLQHYWGPMANIESTRWILKAAAWLDQHHRPAFHWVYLPHLDYASQKFGPDSPQSRSGLKELDDALTVFQAHLDDMPDGSEPIVLVVGEYALTDVTGVVFPNRVLREHGLLEVIERDGVENLDMGKSQAFAMVDHQFAHVYVQPTLPPAQRRSLAARIVDVFRGVPGMAAVYGEDDRACVGLNHPRSGEVILLCDDAHWSAYYWWFHDDLAPPFARTVDIHRKPGYDPVELFFDPHTKGIPLDTSLVKGSHGVPAEEPRHRTALMCTARGGPVQDGSFHVDRDVKRICLELLGAI
ncbi:MAG: nucleotide pyrophosphatase/phosphodiesterase family protein [Planctomycetota bacterium]